MSEETSPVPQHIAIIMDGNGRWAKQRHQPRFMGHRAGVKSVEAIVKHCVERGVSVLSLFAFSSENWRRPGKEVSLLMELFALALKQQVRRLHKNNIRLHIIGDTSKFSESLQKQITEAEQLTADNIGLTINIAANYGGHWDITQSVQKLAEKVKAGEIVPSDITEDSISNGLTTAFLPDPDLFIRTGGEQRVSNFLLWQLAYTEFYFTDTLWPDFDDNELDIAISSFCNRERRFGKTSEQIQEEINA
ncbi:MAG: isoprenyl transferase [Gammaproteobacteria bacterium]|nr:MAG: isoprenyl transferase [Gammaproteobacteria bacterium]RKZ96504.1 MAG: isoprenyl transferase [Gammaproteobacteria bacterium]